jgi:hypothetical protein
MAPNLPLPPCQNGHHLTLSLRLSSLCVTGERRNATCSNYRESGNGANYNEWAISLGFLAILIPRFESKSEPEILNL